MICNDDPNVTSHFNVKSHDSTTESGESTIITDSSSAWEHVTEGEAFAGMSVTKEASVEGDIVPGIGASASVSATISASIRLRHEYSKSDSRSKGTSDTKSTEKTSGNELEFTIDTPPRTVKSMRIFKTTKTTSLPWTCNVDLVFEKGFELKGGEIKGVFTGVSTSKSVTSFHTYKLKENEDCIDVDGSAEAKKKDKEGISLAEVKDENEESLVEVQDEKEESLVEIKKIDTYSEPENQTMHQALFKNMGRY